MHRFFVPPENIKKSEIVITGSDVKHLSQVLRLCLGDEILVCDGKGLECRVAISQIDKEKVKGIILQRISRVEKSPRVALFQGIPKNPKMDLIIRQTTELGISEIVPLVTERSAVKLDQAERAKKQIRWQKIALEAAKQSQRLSIPEVSAISFWVEGLERLKEFELVLVPWEEEKKQGIKPFLHPGSQKSIAIVIGPEGGFSASEIESLSLIGGKIVSLGEKILRTETAGLVTLAIVLYELREGSN